MLRQDGVAAVKCAVACCIVYVCPSVGGDWVAFAWRVALTWCPEPHVSPALPGLVPSMTRSTVAELSIVYTKVCD
jgi:hypothetical protein